jgi:hypothetical protein
MIQRLIRIAAPVVAGFTLGLWLVLGANMGFTKNQVQEIHTDEITGIEHVVWRETWIPGVDFLAVGLACSAGLLLGSFALRKKKQRTDSP